MIYFVKAPQTQIWGNDSIGNPAWVWKTNYLPGTYQRTSKGKSSIMLTICFCPKCGQSFHATDIDGTTPAPARWEGSVWIAALDGTEGKGKGVCPNGDFLDDIIFLNWDKH